VPEYLGHVLDAIERIKRHVAGFDEAGFLRDEKTQDAVIRNFEVIGEAAKNIQTADPGFVEKHSAVPWKVVVAMRNRVAHGYFEVDLGVVWKTVRDDLPALEAQLREISKGLGAPNGS
jgi:uncharacterized protein with HEPN domain